MGLVSVVNELVVSGKDIQVFYSPKEYKQQVLSLIKSAKKRIYITALYLQNDDAGQEILHALYQAKSDFPDLDIKVFVDFHRAQRGLIGEKNSLGNRALYLELEDKYQQSIDIYGVAVKPREVFGVLHLKGFVFDDQLFYTGASINDIYFHQHDRYRLDRYYQISSRDLSNCFCDFLNENFIKTKLAPRLNGGDLPNKLELREIIHRLKSLVKKAQYKPYLSGNTRLIENGILLTPLVGCGPRRNRLNSKICQIAQNCQTELRLLTPYFNLPRALAKEVNKALKRGVKVTLIIGDKTANDFYIPPSEPFTTIGIVPYLYEVLLARYVKKQQKYIDDGLLEIRLWQDGSNSFHLKGLVADQRYHLITGSNLNPRAWALDLENGIVLDDAQKQLMPAFEKEWQGIVKNTAVIKNHLQIDDINSYPEKPRNLLKKLRAVQIDRLLKRLL
jgi:CDP-diacylglycerol--serine O-phosphatidyltransferase